MKANEVLEQYANGLRDFRGVNLRGQSFEGENLSKADFSEADLEGANFSNANLIGTNFTGSKAGLKRQWKIFVRIISRLLALVAVINSYATSSAVITAIGSPSNFLYFVPLCLVCLVFVFVTVNGKFITGIISAAGVIALTAVIPVDGIGFLTAIEANFLVGAVVSGAIFAYAVTLAGALTIEEAASITISGIIATVLVVVVSALGQNQEMLEAAVTHAGSAAKFYTEERVAQITPQVIQEMGKLMTPLVSVEKLVLSEIIIGLGLYMAWRTLANNMPYSFAKDFALASAGIGGTSFNTADLTDAKLTKAMLKNTDFRDAILTRTCFYQAEMLDFVRSGKTYLQDSEICELIVTRKGANKNFDSKNLRGLNLQEANLADASFIGTELSEVSLQNANLSKAKLVQTQLDRANLAEAILTGACIEDWNINSQTNLNNLICDYIYLQEGRQERRPHDPNKNFEPGEFTKLFQKVLETVDLVFLDGIDWQTFLTSFNRLQVKCGSDDLAIQAIEKKSGGAFVIRVEIPFDVDKASIEKSFWQIYKPLLEAKDEQIAFYCQEIENKRQENTQLIEIVKTMSEKDNRTINANAYYEQSGKHGIGHMSGGNIQEGAKVAGVINEAQQQNLAEAAGEIQQLLEQLTEAYPTTTYEEKTAVVGEVVDRIESNPTLKAKVINALKAGGTEAFKEAIDHPLVNILVASIEGWQDAE